VGSELKYVCVSVRVYVCVSVRVNVSVYVRVCACACVLIESECGRSLFQAYTM
jgi:hypothetical protein